MSSPSATATRTTRVTKVTHRSHAIEPDDQKIDQPSPIDLGMGNTPFIRPGADVIVAEKGMTPDETWLHAFYEEGLEIEVIQGAGDHAPLFEMGSVNGIGVERYLEGIGWFEAKFVPVNEPVIVKRKYVDQWVRLKVTTVSTPEDKADGSEPKNLLVKRHTAARSVRLVNDPIPPGETDAQRRYRAEWFRKLQRMAA